MEQDLTLYVDSLFTNMENFTQNDGLIGKPVTQGDKTFLPVMSITFGFGGGDSASKLKQNAGSTSGVGNIMGGGALGIGAKLSTDAVLIIDNNNLLLAPIGTPSGVSQMIEKIPQILSNMNIGGAQAGQQANQGNTTSGGGQGTMQ